MPGLTLFSNKTVFHRFPALTINHFFNELNNTHETMLAHTGKVNKKHSFKQSKNEVCVDCLDNTLNLSSYASRVNIAYRCI